jgi:hypothetical protein
LEQSRFALPLVCHQPSSWSLRRHLPNERWSVMDVPWPIARLTCAMEVREELALFRGLLPGRCLKQGLQVLLRRYGLMTEGGGLPFESLTKQELMQAGKQEIEIKERNRSMAWKAQRSKEMLMSQMRQMISEEMLKSLMSQKIRQRIWRICRRS